METPIGKLTFDKEIITVSGFNVTTLLRDKQNNPILSETFNELADDFRKG